MDLAIDVGGTKTLLAVFTSGGQLVKSERFDTPKDYDSFKQTLANGVKSLDESFNNACCAIPGRIDRAEGMALGYGTLPWQPAPVKSDLEKLIDCKVLVENDAKLAGLSEAVAAPDSYRKILYVTIGTGIGTALLVDKKIDSSLADSEGGQIWVERDGKRLQWEDLVSGRSILKRFGKRASEIEDHEIWRIIAQDLGDGIYDLIAVIQPQLVIIGGGIGTYFTNYGKQLNEYLSEQATSLVPIPPVIQAKRPEEAVIYGCYEFIKQNTFE